MLILFWNQILKLALLTANTTHYKCLTEGAGMSFEKGRGGCRSTWGKSIWHPSQAHGAVLAVHARPWRCCALWDISTGNLNRFPMLLCNKKKRKKDCCRLYFCLHFPSALSESCGNEQRHHMKLKVHDLMGDQFDFISGPGSLCHGVTWPERTESNCKRISTIHRTVY